MTQANDSVTVTPGAGATIATHLINGKEYQAVVVAGDQGHIHGSKPSYLLWIPPQVAAANKIFFDLFNATGSGRTIEINGIWAITKIDVAVTGAVAVELLLQRTSAVGTGGTTVTTSTATGTPGIAAKNPANAALPAQITARQVPTGGATVQAHLFSTYQFPEETNAGTILQQYQNLIPNINEETQPVVLPETYGIRVVQGTVASLNSYGFLVDFSVF